MRLRRFFILFFLIYNLPLQLCAMKITSVADGNWDDSTAWANGKLPGYSFGDTVEINHCIFFNKNLQLNSGALLTIEDSGKICGNHTIYSKPGSEIDVFGRIYFDTLFVQGYWYVNNNNQAWIGQYITITAPGHGLVIGPAFFTYYPFTCSCNFDSIPAPPNDTFTVVNESNEIEIETNPNPFTEFIYFKTNASIDLLYITDDMGRLVFRKKPEDDFIDLRHLLPGTYFLNFIITNGKKITKKVVKL